MNLTIILHTASGLSLDSETAVARLIVRNNHPVCDIAIFFILPRTAKYQATRSKRSRLPTTSGELKGKRFYFRLSTIT